MPHLRPTYAPPTMPLCQAEVFGAPSVADTVHRWLVAVLHDDGMVDSFAELHPDARGRFTCWDQHTNQVTIPLADMATTIRRC